MTQARSHEGARTAKSRRRGLEASRLRRPLVRLVVGLAMVAESAALAKGLYAPQPRQKAPARYKKDDISSFRDLRNEILNLIGGAKQRAWLVTNYLTDGEIVAALYLAKYRRLDVKILLGHQKARQYMSRLDYLKRQNMSVYLVPPDFPFKSPTSLLVDDELYLADSELDFMTAQSQFKVERTRPSTANQFAEAFAAAMGRGIAAIPVPMQKVGRPTSPYRMRQNGAKSYQGSPDGSYNYDSVGRGAYAMPDNVPKKLPAEPLYRKRQMRQLNEAKNSPQDKRPSPAPESAPAPRADSIPSVAPSTQD